MARAEPVQFNPLLPEVIENPCPLYDRLRAEEPDSEGQIALGTLFRLDHGEWRQTATLRGLAALPVRV